MKEWGPVMDRLRAGVEELHECQVRGQDAPRAAKLAAQVNRRLWFWQRDIEALYLNRIGTIPQMVATVAQQEEVPLMQLLYELLDDQALGVRWDKLDRWATNHGIELFPKLEEESDDGSQEADDQ